MGQTDLKPTAQGQVESSINDTINFIMAKVAAGEIDAATATELIAAARKDYESNVPVTTSAQQAVQLQQTANPYQADPQTAYAVPEMEPEQTPIDYGQFATSTNYPHTYDVEDSSDVDMDALSGIASDVFDKQPRKKLSRKERKARAKEMKKLQKESNAKLKANAKSNKSIQKQLKDRDKELSKKNEFARYRRKTAKDVTSFIGYNRMYEDGICEVEETRLFLMKISTPHEASNFLNSVAAALLRKKRKNLMIHNRVLRTGTCRFIMTKRFSRPCHFCVPIFVIWKIPAATCKRIFSVDVFTNVFRVPRRADCFLFKPSPFHCQLEP